jgi:hypothetical protein
MSPPQANTSPFRRRDPQKSPASFRSRAKSLIKRSGFTNESLYRNSEKNPWPLREGRAPTKRPRDAADSQSPHQRCRYRQCVGSTRRDLRCAPPWCSFSSFRASRPAPRTHLPPASPAALPRGWGVHVQGGNVYVYRVAGGRWSGALQRMRSGRGLGRCAPPMLTARTWNVCVSPGTKLREEAADILSAISSCCSTNGRCSAEQGGLCDAGNMSESEPESTALRTSQVLLGNYRGGRPTATDPQGSAPPVQPLLPFMPTRNHNMHLLTSTPALNVSIK